MGKYIESLKGQAESFDKQREQPQASWIGKELGKEYLAIHGASEARKALRYFLGQALRGIAVDSDGIPSFQKMTEGHTSGLAWWFMEALTAGEVFSREKKLLTFREYEILMMRFREELSFEDIMARTGLARRTIDDALRRALDRMMPLIFGD